jgi:MoaA/NifB/PqqE/SkfB family radical SAM enzyme/protein-L-isoaspartate O-methyltransferase
MGGAMRGDQFFAEIWNRPPFTKLHPRVGAFFQEYFSREKIIRFENRFVVNTNFPPYPSAAFDHLVQQFSELGDAATRRLYSLTLAVTNRCPFHCWHCYNAGRNQTDIPAVKLKNLAGEVQDLGAVIVTLTGGEPLLRSDLEEIAANFDSRSCLILGTTGEGLTHDRARSLCQAGFFAAGISLDSSLESDHDRMRGRTGAFRAALRAIEAARANGLYPYVVSVATRDFLQRERFLDFLRFARDAGALEVHLLEPSATGRLAGQTEVLLTAAERTRLFEYQAEVAQRDDLPILSAFAYLESPEAFGCGAGLTHLYVDGSGEVCPCNLVPLSFGNVTAQPFRQILDRMGNFFCRPRTGCLGRLLVKHFPATGLPAGPGQSEEICRKYLPSRHALPAFFRLRDKVRDQDAGQPELQSAYDKIHGNYDEFWLVEAAGPVDDLVRELSWSGAEKAFEAGCGTGYGTAQLARRASLVLAVDLSPEMLAEARARIEREGLTNVRFMAGDAVSKIQTEGPFDLIFSSWVLGYIPMAPFFETAGRALAPGGQLGFVVHRENSPREPLEIFAELIAQEPAALRKRVAFDFPRDAEHVRGILQAAGFAVEKLQEGGIEFRYDTAEKVLEHLVKSGAGTVFYDAVDPVRREVLTSRFLKRLTERNGEETGFKVRHDYITCIARKK